MQTLHYLTLSFLIPPLLSLFAEPSSLLYEGGAANVGKYLCVFFPMCKPNTHLGMVMDWREMAGRPTVRGLQGEGSLWSPYEGAWSGGRKVGYYGGWGQDRWEGRTDPMRGWIIAFCWIVASGAE